MTLHLVRVFYLKGAEKIFAFLFLLVRWVPYSFTLSYKIEKLITSSSSSPSSSITMWTAEQEHRSWYKWFRGIKTVMMSKSATYLPHETASCKMENMWGRKQTKPHRGQTFVNQSINPITTGSRSGFLSCFALTLYDVHLSSLEVWVDESD
jgi:hypothetical protein